ncbi:PAS domain-containing sensor histidine kinase [Salisaeta longa]|uniref:PAS domain-containing sensor histidine kinase n=1 Tax=Salisaeta longa TaxID=503170 RepID=UPI0003B2EEE7|nr:PAS domain-containing sensor histidine kinase [Salisaeta longa]
MLHLFPEGHFGRTLGRTFLLAGVLAGLWTAPSIAQPLTPGQIIDAAARAALQGPVRVVGRASVASNVLEKRRVFIQHDTSGIALDLPQKGPPVQRGDSVVATGTVRTIYGLPVMKVTSYEVVPTPPEPPAPVPLSLPEAVGNRYEGQLIRIQGHVVNKGSNGGGHYLLMNMRERRAVLAVFVDHERLQPVPLTSYEIGDEIVVTGILGQYDLTKPYTSYYEVYPRTPDDITYAATPRRYLEWIGIASAIAIAIGLLVVGLLYVRLRRRSRELSESRTRFKRLAEATSEGILVHCEGTIVDANTALSTMTGYPRETILGSNVLNYLTESSRTVVRERLKTQGEKPYEGTILRKDGTTFTAEIEARNIQMDDRVVRVVAVRDVTERKRYEAELTKAKEQAEAVARLKSSLLGNMSHELRTPITSIIGYAEIIRDDPEAPHAAFARHIYANGQRLANTLDAVLEMAQLESGMLQVTPYSVHAHELMAEVLAAFEAAAQQKGLALDMTVAEDVSLETDRALLHRVLRHLVDNAIKFTPEGSVHLSAENTADGVRFIVRDTGIGISPAFQLQLFEPFTQASRGHSRTHEGTGLGLAITKRMVHLLHGTITFQSTPGYGTTFIVTLPHVHASQNASSPVMDDVSA